MAALFNNRRRLLGVVYWASTATVASFKSRARINPAPYRVAGTYGTPDSIFVVETIGGDLEMEYRMTFVVQLYVLLDVYIDFTNPFASLGRSLKAFVAEEETVLYT